MNKISDDKFKINYKCKTHKNKSLIGYCKQEKVYLCSICMKDHYSHGNGNILPFDENKINLMINKHRQLNAKAQRKI